MFTKLTKLIDSFLETGILFYEKFQQKRTKITDIIQEIYK